MTVLASDPFVTAEQAAHHGVELVSFDDARSRGPTSITVHVPLTRATRGLIGRDQLARMKRGAILLNVARGGVIDEAAVAGGARQRASSRGAGDRRLRDRAADGLAAARRAEHAPDPAPRRVDRGGPGRSSPRRSPTRSSTSSPGRSARYAVNAPLLTPETAEALAPYLPLAEMLGRFFAQFAPERRPDADARDRRRARRRSTRSPLVAAVLRGHDRDVDDRAGQPRERGRAREGPRDHGRRAQDARRRRVRRAAQPVGRERRRGRRRSPAPSPAARPDSPGSTTTASTWSPTDVMLITHHRDRPGMIGRIGQTLGEADVNISAMHVGRSAPRADALMILALDDDVPPGGRRGDPGPRSVIDAVDDPARARALTVDRPAASATPPASSPTGSTRRSSSSATASRSSSSRAGSRARPRRRSRPIGRRQAAPRRGAPRPPARAARRCRSRRRRRSRSSIRRSSGPPRRPARSRAAMADAGGLRRGRSRPGPIAGFLEIGQGEWEGLHRDGDRGPLGRRPGGVAAAAARGVGARRRAARRRPGAASGRHSPDPVASSPRPGRPGSLDGAAGRRLPRRREPDAARGRSSSATTASSRSCC